MNDLPVESAGRVVPSTTAPRRQGPIQPARLPSLSFFLLACHLCSLYLYTYQFASWCLTSPMQSPLSIRLDQWLVSHVQSVKTKARCRLQEDCCISRLWVCQPVKFNSAAAYGRRAACWLSLAELRFKRRTNKFPWAEVLTHSEIMRHLKSIVDMQYIWWLN